MIIITGTIISVLVIIASLVIGKSISKPIIRLRDASKEIANGNLDIILNETDNLDLDENKDKNNKDEIKDLAFQFDKMRRKINYTNTNLQELVYQKTEDLEKAIEDLREKEKHLMEANEKLRLLDKLKSDFINIAAHELRTPTQAILAFADLLTIHPEKKIVIETIQRNARRLKRLISDILDVTKIENQRLILKKETLNITNLVSSTIDEYREQLKKMALTKKIEIYLDFPKGKDLFVYADKERMVQVISNLLDNSVKFIEEEGSIHLKAKIARNEEKKKEMKDEDDSRDQVIISIKDTGISIPEEIFPILFTKFTTKSITGSGLGLYISKSIIEAHGGRICAGNNTDCKGVTFTLSLPLSKIENAAATTTNLGEPKMENKKKKILVVDDEPDLTVACNMLLEDEGFQVDTFNDPLLALSSFKPNYYDLALFDIKMPKLDGFSLYNEIKKIDDKIKICFLTASESYYEEYRKEEFNKLDKDLFIQKPIENEELIKRIDKVLNSM